MEIQSESFSVAINSIYEIMRIVNIKTALSELIKFGLRKYSYKKTERILNEINLLQTYEIRTDLSNLSQNYEAKPLLTDNLIPISAAINQYNSNKNPNNKKYFLNKKKNLHNNNNNNNNNKQQNKKEQIKQIQIKQISFLQQQQDGLIKEMRKMQEQKIKKKSQQNILLDDYNIEINKKQYENKISFDYNGSTIKINMEIKYNLKPDIINSKIIKQLENKINNSNKLPNVIDRNNQKKKQKNQITNSHNNNNNFKSTQVSFSNVNSLIDKIQIKKGIKIKHNAILLEDKKKQQNIQNIQQILKTKRLTKDQFQKLKFETTKTNVSKQESSKAKIENIKKLNEQIQTIPLHHRSQSESKFIMKLDKNKNSTIHISNQKMHTKMMNDEDKQWRHATPEKEIVIKKKKMDSIDTYNLEYIKLGGQTNSEIKLKTEHTIASKLPSIKNKLLIIRPKNRQKLKQSAQVIMELRKKFEDKLRI